MTYIYWLQDSWQRWGRPGGPVQKGIVWAVFVVALLVGLVILCLWTIGKLAGMLSIGRVRNLELYFPAKRRGR